MFTGNRLYFDILNIPFLYLWFICGLPMFCSFETYSLLYFFNDFEKASCDFSHLYFGDFFQLLKLDSTFVLFSYVIF